MVAKLAVFDIDDTLLASNKTFLKSTLTSIKKLKQQQINVAIATGRNLAMAKAVIHKLDLNDFVLCNGSAALPTINRFMNIRSRVITWQH